MRLPFYVKNERRSSSKIYLEIDDFIDNSCELIERRIDFVEKSLVDERVPADIQKSFFETKGHFADMVFHEGHENWGDSFFEVGEAGEDVLRLDFGGADVHLAAQKLGGALGQFVNILG